MYTHYMKKLKYTYTLIYINILGPPPQLSPLRPPPATAFLADKNLFMHLLLPDPLCCRRHSE